MKKAQIFDLLRGLFAVLFVFAGLTTGGLNSPAGFFVAKASGETLPISNSDKSMYVYRFWSDVFRGHFYTSTYSEAQNVKNTDSNWSYEQVAFSVYNLEQPNTIPVYRFWSPVFKGHFYTSSQEEYERVKNTDSNWQYERVAFYVFPLDYEGQSETVWRFWSPVFRHHFYTADFEEMERVKNTDSNWDFEGPAFKVPLEFEETENTIAKGGQGDLIVVNNEELQVEEVANSSNNQIYDPIPDHRIISLSIVLRNAGTEPISYNAKDFLLVDQLTGEIYDSINTLCILEPCLDEIGQIMPGETVQGYLSYEVPVSTSDIKLGYISEKMTEQNNSIEVDLNFKSEVVVISNKVVYDNFSGEQIVGKVRNNTDKPVRYIKITADFYDKKGNLLSSDFSYAEGAESEYLQSGEIANFRIWFDQSSQVYSYDLTVDWRTY